MRRFFPTILAVAFALAVMFPALGGAMRAHAYESAGTVYVNDRDAPSQSHQFDAPSHVENMKQGDKATDGSGQCPEGQACCEVLCQVASIPSDFGRMDAKLDNNRLAAMIVAPAAKQRPTLIDRPPKSIDPIFG